MTSAEFSAKYQLIKPVADGPVRTLNARATTTGAMVMVHYLIGSPEENRKIIEDIGKLPPLDRGKIIEVADVEGNAVVVTQFLPGFASLAGWLTGHIPQGKGPIKVTLKKDGGAVGGSGTQPFQGGFGKGGGGGTWGGP